jgi:nucleoside-diphosphate-sugar epimerase
VRAVVRSESKIHYIRKQVRHRYRKGFFSCSSEYDDKLEFAVIEDFSLPGSLDDAMQGIDGVIHTATAKMFHAPETHPDDWIKPSVNMTLEILKSAAKTSSVRRVVITSSMDAVFSAEEGKTLYTEVFGSL